MQSVMQHQFSQIPSAEIPRSVFNRVFGHKTTFDAGQLIPFYVDEALPGDTFNLHTTLFGRLSTPLYPIMDNLFMDVHFFAVPYRLVWANFKKFMGEQASPGDSTSFTVPQTVAAGGWATGTLGDYMGLPTQVNGLSVNVLPFRAYNLIWQEWYRDQNIQNTAYIRTDDANQAVSEFPIQIRGKRHDYFTSCLPWPQKGTAISIPLGTVAPVTGIGKINQNYPQVPTVYQTGGSSSTVFTNATYIDGTGADQQFYVKGTAATGGYPAIYADLTNATAATINSLRQAFQLQKLMERDARGGTRYTEVIRAHFGVTSPDMRMQRPEYLGGTTASVNINPVPSTVKETTRPQGSVAAFGTLTAQAGFTASFTEHCVVMGIVSVRADLTYQQGLRKMWSRSTKYDFYWPGLANIGEQAVLNKEIYCKADANDNLVFGYQERWAEYRYFPSLITGKFRSNAVGTLDAWHLSQNFGSLPTLSDTFIKETPPMSRILAVGTEPHILLDSYTQIKTARPMPVYSVPGLIDHF